MRLRFHAVVIPLASLLAASALSFGQDFAASKPSLQLEVSLRRPVAMALLDQGNRLVVANRSGSLSLIDTQTNRLLSETALKAGSLRRQLADLAATQTHNRLLAVDEFGGKLLVLSSLHDVIVQQAQVEVAPSPVSVVANSDGGTCFVASLWSRKLTVVSLTSGPRVTKTLNLPFPPRELLLVRNDTKLIVADAFAGKLGVVDVQTARLEAVRDLPAHNIRGLAQSPDGKKLLVAHQILNDLAETTHNDVHWGVLMSNVLRWLVLDNVLDPAAELLAGSHVHLTGDSANPGADPSGIAVAADGTAFVALAGAGELGLGNEQDYSLVRIGVGRRPTSVVLSADARRAYVANTFGDSISIVDINHGRTQPARYGNEISLGPQPTLTQVQQGELLFYDARLSSDGWFSCHSCHTDGHTNGLLNDNQGDGSFGAAKRVLSLLGVADTAPWAWDGSVTNLESQVHKSIGTTMQGPEPTQEQVQALTAYVRTLKPPPVSSSFDQQTSATIARGRALFEREQCDSCHRPPTYTSPESYDVGLVDKLGNRVFNAPSLRGVGHRDRLFHDNRAAGLEEVFTNYQHQTQTKLSYTDLADLIVFLRSL